MNKHKLLVRAEAYFLLLNDGAYFLFNQGMYYFVRFALSLKVSSVLDQPFGDYRDLCGFLIHS